MGDDLRQAENKTGPAAVIFAAGPVFKVD